MSKAIKQKLNTKSSNEVEVIGARDYFPQTIWAKNLLEAQGFYITKNQFYQDNQSALHLEQYGCIIRYFFIVDCIGIEHDNLVHYPTEDMLADWFTKTLEGALFIRFRTVLLGHSPINTLSKPKALTPTEERVEDISVYPDSGFRIPTSNDGTPAVNLSSPLVAVIAHSNQFQATTTNVRAAEEPKQNEKWSLTSSNYVETITSQTNEQLIDYLFLFYTLEASPSTNEPVTTSLVVT